MSPRISGPLEGRKKHGLQTAQLNHGPLMGLKQFNVHDGPISPRAVNGPKDEKASYGPKDITGHRWAESDSGLESYGTAHMTLLGRILKGHNRP
jgi:hypothetical protein